MNDSIMIREDEPSENKNVIAGLEAAKWIEAIESEIQSMHDNQVQNLVDPTVGFKIIGCTYIFKNKTDMDGIYTH